MSRKLTALIVGLVASLAFGFLAYPQARTEESLAWLKAQLGP